MDEGNTCFEALLNLFVKKKIIPVKKQQSTTAASPPSLRRLAPGQRRTAERPDPVPVAHRQQQLKGARTVAMDRWRTLLFQFNRISRERPRSRVHTGRRRERRSDSFRLHGCCQRL
jgi:hypothetical protein